MSQSNTQEGAIVLESGNGLKGKEGFLVTIDNASGKPKFFLAGATPKSLFVVIDGDDLEKTSAALPLSPDRSVRIKLSGTCEPGDVLVTALPGSSSGMVRKLPTTAGIYSVVGIAEESGVHNQLVKVRPGIVATVTV